jgi:hypothetical protein
VNSKARNPAAHIPMLYRERWPERPRLVRLNEPEQAEAWIEETAATGFPCYPFLERDHALDPIREDPRFVAFMQKLKPLWEHFKSTYGSAAAARSPANQ